VKADILILGESNFNINQNYECESQDSMVLLGGKVAAAVAVAALEVVREENLSVNAERLGVLRKD
jgi:ornithine--oxo-acid transaminase